MTNHTVCHHLQEVLGPSDPVWEPSCQGHGFPCKGRRCPRGKSVFLGSPSSRIASVHFTEIPCAFGLLCMCVHACVCVCVCVVGGGVQGIPHFGGSWLQSIRAASPGSRSSPRPLPSAAHPRRPRLTPPCAAPAPVRPSPLRAAGLRSRRPGCVGSWRAGCAGGLGRASQGSLNLDAIRGNQPKTPRQLLPRDYSQPAKGIRVIIPSLDF